MHTEDTILPHMCNVRLVFVEDDASVPVDTFLTSLTVDCAGHPTISNVLRAVFSPRLALPANLALSQLYDRFYARLSGAYAVGFATIWTAAESGELAALSRPDRGFTTLGYLREAWQSGAKIHAAIAGQSAIENICRVNSAASLTTYILYIYPVRDGPSVSRATNSTRMHIY